MYVEPVALVTAGGDAGATGPCGLDAPGKGREGGGGGERLGRRSALTIHLGGQDGAAVASSHSRTSVLEGSPLRGGVLRRSTTDGTHVRLYILVWQRQGVCHACVTRSDLTAKWCIQAGCLGLPTCWSVADCAACAEVVVPNTASSQHMEACPVQLAPTGRRP